MDQHPIDKAIEVTRDVLTEPGGGHFGSDTLALYVEQILANQLVILEWLRSGATTANPEDVSEYSYWKKGSDPTLRKWSEFGL